LRNCGSSRVARNQEGDHCSADLRSVSSIKPGAPVLWDTGKGSVTGFGARRQKGDAISYVLKYRTSEGRQRWYTIGRHGAPWTPDMARDEALRILGEVVKGVDPADAKQEERRADTVADLCDAYIEAAGAGKLLTRRRRPKRASTLATDKGRVERHIKPLLGRMKVAAVSRRDIERFQDAVAEGKTAARVKTGKHGLARVTGGIGTATRTMALLGVIFSYAVKRGLRPDNPVHGVETHAYAQRQRRASDAEYAALGTTLRTMPATTWPMAVAGAKFLAVTGWRRGEMLALRWSEVDLATRTARLGDTKTGASMRPLSHAACEVIRTLPRLGSDLVFPASTGTDKQMGGFHMTWLRIAAKAGLPDDVTPHVLRHSFASVAADLGFSELTIAALLGHRKVTVTSKYAHHADAVLLKAADDVADRIAELMGEARGAGMVVELRPERTAR
jgi:integrase